MAKLKKPPGPHLFTRWEKPPRNFPDLVEKLMVRYGGICHFPGLIKIYLVTDPVCIQQVLHSNMDNYPKTGFHYRRLALMLGQGLLTNTTPTWQHQRDLLQPFFQRKNTDGLVPTVVSITQDKMHEWRKHADQNNTLDLSHIIMDVVLANAAKILFNTEFSAQDRHDILTTVDIGNQFVPKTIALPLWFPSWLNYRFKRSEKKLNAILTRMITERREHPQADSHDLLSVMLSAQAKNPAGILTDSFVHDEVKTFLVTGHETCGRTLTWVWHCLQQNPECYEKAIAEVNSVLGDRPATVDDLPQLNYLRMVLEETMRLYPPLWAMMRLAVNEDCIAGYRIPAKSTLMVSTYGVHRHPDYWENPHVFNPENFTKIKKAERPAFSYLPFGVGPKICISSQFAMTQSILILATILQHYRIKIISRGKVKPQFLVTLKPRKKVKVKLETS